MILHRRFLTQLSILALLFASAPSLVWSAGLIVQLDRERLSLHETLTLHLTADGSTQGDPDFAALMQDFDILRRGQSKMTRIINGVMSQTREWTLELAPKHSGRLTVPSLTLGNAHSQSAVVDVTDTPTTSGARPLFMQAETGTQTPYVQQVFEYRVRIYFQQPPQSATLSDPVADGATIERVGEDRADEAVIDGQHYQVIERRYRVIPQRSGLLKIQSPRLDAMVPEPRSGSQRDPFADLDDAFGGTFFQGLPPGFAASGRRVLERADDLTLQVRAQPDGAGTPWLPAISVQIADEWTPAQPVFRVGEPLTRTLTITAQGVTAAQLPTLDVGTPDGVQVYADQPQGEDLAAAPVPTAIKTVKVALVPTRPGSLTLPEIRVPWWDTVADAPKVAVVPAHTVEVAANPAAVAAPPPAAPATHVSPPPLVAAPSPQNLPSEPNSVWFWLTLLLCLAWLGTLLWWWRERRSRRLAFQSVESVTTSLNAARHQIKLACLAGDARVARQALMAWAQIRWPDDVPSGLSELGQRLGGDDGRALLETLDRVIYAESGAVWDGAAAWRRLAPWLDARSSTPADDPLPPLYPRI